jgi:hypothetical protein
MLRFFRRSKPHRDLDQALTRFLGAFQFVFEDDWQYTRELLRQDMDYAVDSNGTFINPGPNYKNKNW